MLFDLCDSEVNSAAKGEKAGASASERGCPTRSSPTLFLLAHMPARHYMN